ncbi:MAG: hypothetical protein AAF618_00065 [Pseudomonadota bacterium]
MISYEAIRAHIAAELPQFLDVGLAGNLADALSRGNARYPSAYVFPLSEVGGPNRFMNEAVIDQEVRERFSVLLLVRSVGARRSEEAIDDIEVIRPALKTALGRYRPEGAHGGCRHYQGQLTSNIGQGGKLVWQDSFEVLTSERILAA